MTQLRRKYTLRRLSRKEYGAPYPQYRLAAGLLHRMVHQQDMHDWRSHTFASAVVGSNANNVRKVCEKAAHHKYRMLAMEAQIVLAKEHAQHQLRSRFLKRRVH